LARPHDAPRRNASKFFGALEFGGECVSIRAGGAAHDTPAKLVPSVARGIVPGPVVGNRALDRKEPLIVIGDDEEESPGDGRGRRFNDCQVRRGHAEQTPVSVISMRFIGPSAEKNLDRIPAAGVERQVASAWAVRAPYRF
jgi:hypothetical protein